MGKSTLQAGDAGAEQDNISRSAMNYFWVAAAEEYCRAAGTIAILAVGEPGHSDYFGILYKNKNNQSSIASHAAHGHIRHTTDNNTRNNKGGARI